MACVLKSVPGGEFEGPTGQKFTIELRADAGKPKILSATYGSTTLKASPFTFELSEFKSVDSHDKSVFAKPD